MFVKPYVLQAGAGEAVQIGDIVTVRKYILDTDATTITKDMGPIWFWVGYRRPQDGRFFKCLKMENSCDVESGVVGLKTGSWFYYPINDVSVASWRNKDGHLDPRCGSELVLGGEVASSCWKTQLPFAIPCLPSPHLIWSSNSRTPSWLAAWAQWCRGSSTTWCSAARPNCTSGR
ncbi:hypothetical protein H0I39_13155 [Ottowia beijingensis]|uniref:Uncharacterized protein n=1 Tax=Ottowia beijingensis TaxID=1207057 RepID=A0A853IYB6_9BURK|nr:hypothetical protein [Ottowia beijingensis]NZA02468.1 hypothetical protein [Ottowia beijingensis]